MFGERCQCVLCEQGNPLGLQRASGAWAWSKDCNKIMGFNKKGDCIIDLITFDHLVAAAAAPVAPGDELPRGSALETALPQDAFWRPLTLIPTTRYGRD